MNCRFDQDAAAYVIGALSPSERLDFEKHLGGCDECTRTIRELAGIPGLLGRVEPSVLEHPVVEGPGVPDTLLPTLSRRVRGARRRRTLIAAGVAAAAVAVMALPTATRLAAASPLPRFPAAVCSCWSASCRSVTCEW